MHKINKELYPKKWQELISKHGEEQAEKEYRRFCKSFTLEKYVYKYGEDDGTKRFLEKKRNRRYGNSLENCIFRHGEVKGREVYEKWKANCRISLEMFVKKYGSEEGLNRFNEFKRKAFQALKNAIPYKERNQSTRLKYWIGKCDGNVEEAKIKLAERQNTSSLEKLIKKYGETVGAKKYQEINRKKAMTIAKCIELYGEECGKIRYEKHIQNLKYCHSKERYIKKYGEDVGLKKYTEILNKRVAHDFPNNYSLIGLEFCESLNNILKHTFKKLYYGDKEYKFFIHSDGFKIIVPDFYIKDINVVVEFYGDYWHRHPKLYNDEISIKIREKDNLRIDALKQKFQCNVISVWESDYRENKEQTIKDVLKKIEEYERNY